MLAKVIAHAPTRSEAVLRLALALERMQIQGMVTNRDFLVNTLRHPDFLAGNTSTDFIDRVRPDRVRHADPTAVRSAAIVAALAAQAWRRRDAHTLASLRSGWRNSVMPSQRTTFRHRDADIEVAYRGERDGSFTVDAEGATSRAVVHHCGDDMIDVELDGRRVAATVHRHDGRWWVHLSGGDLTLDELPQFPEPEAEVVVGGLTAQMPGKVLATYCAIGDRVDEGQTLVLLEAMKMEHQIVAPFAGTVTDLTVAPGDQVGTGHMLVVIDGA